MWSRRHFAPPATLLLLTLFLLLTQLLLASGCDRRAMPAPASPPAASPTVALPTVASLVPAATELILSMGMGSHLVAVSTYDSARPGAAGLPAVGDYLTVDWETLARLAPQIMLVQVNPARLPPGFTQRAADLHIQLANLKIDRLSDVFITMADLGNLLHESDAADRAIRKLHVDLDQVADQWKNAQPVPALLVMDDGGDGVNLIGPNTFLDDLLQLAGGENVAAKLNAPYPSVDREMLSTLRCNVAILLMPGTKSDVAQAAANAWQKQNPGVAQRVEAITDPDALLPGGKIADIARQLAEALHGADHTTSP